MRILTLLAAATALSAGVPAHAQDLDSAVAAVRDRALADHIAWDVVESLTTDVGPRPVGSPAMARARDWGVATLKRLGFQNVHVEAFTTSAWSRGPESAEVVAPRPQKLAIIGLGGSSPTPAGGLTAPIVLFKSYQAMLDQPEGALKGKIAVVTQRMVRTQDGMGYGAINAMRTAGPVEAARRGAVAYLIRSLSTDDTRLPHAGAARPGGIPAAALSTPDAEMLEHMVARGQPVSVHLDMASSVDPKATSWNVVGEIPGREAPDQVIVVGGHLDSWDPGTGAIDDGAGVAIATGAVKAATANGPLKRTLRVVMWGSEEQSGSGAAYAAAHKDEAAGIVVAGESDLGADHLYAISLPPAAFAHPAMKAFRDALPALKTDVSLAPPRFGGSDIEGLMAMGVPFVDFNQSALRYFDLHHSADDTLDKIDPAELAQNVAVWASFLYAAGDSDVDFRAKASGAR